MLLHVVKVCPTCMRHWRKTWRKGVYFGVSFKNVSVNKKYEIKTSKLILSFYFWIIRKSLRTELWFKRPFHVTLQNCKAFKLEKEKEKERKSNSSINSVFKKTHQEKCKLKDVYGFFFQEWPMPCLWEFRLFLVSTPPFIRCLSTSSLALPDTPPWVTFLIHFSFFWFWYLCEHEA